MALRRTELLNIQSITGINTVGILTVGVTQTAGGVGIASTTYLRGVIMHNDEDYRIVIAFDILCDNFSGLVDNLKFKKNAVIKYQ